MKIIWDTPYSIENIKGILFNTFSTSSYDNKVESPITKKHIYFHHLPKYIKFVKSIVRTGAEPLRHGVYALDVLDGLAVDGEGSLGVQLQFQYPAGEHEAEN